MQNARSYELMLDDDVSKETLTQDEDFLTDASIFLAEREDLDLIEPEEIYDAYMEHFRFQNANEITALLDMEYAQDADDEGKLRLGRLMDTFNRMDSDLGWEAVGDYGEAVLKAPSTYLSIATGGAGKVAGVATGAAARGGIRAAMQAAKNKITGGTLTGNTKKEVLKGAVRGGTTDALAGGGTNAMNQQTQQEVGLRDEVDYGEMAAIAGLSATPGMILGGASRGVASKQAVNASQVLRADTRATAARVAAGDAEVAAIESGKGAKKLAAKVKDLKKTHEELNPLDPAKVKEGEELMDSKFPTGDPDTRTALDLNVIKRVAAAAMEVESRLKIKGKDRITTTIADALAEGKIAPEDITGLYARFGITAEDFSKVYLHEISTAGKTLKAQSDLKKFLTGRMERIAQLEDAGVAAVPNHALDALVQANTAMGKFAKGVGNFAKTADKVRLGAMTSQMATAMRNTANGVMRLGVDAAERFIYQLLTNPQKIVTDPIGFTKNIFSTIGGIADQKMSRAVQELLYRRSPEKMGRIFRAMADIEAHTMSAPTDNIMIKGARLANIMNTMSDNMLKRSVITSSIKRQLFDQGKDLNTILRNGEFDSIPPEMIERAMEDALKFTYQYTPKGNNLLSRSAKGFIEWHHELPFVISSFIPFPRFIANSMQFIYEHTPVLPLLQLEKIGTKQPVKQSFSTMAESASKQVAGAGMLTAAFFYRMEANKEGLKWYEFKDPNGEVIDGRAMLGPFAPFFLAADIMARNMEETKGEGGEFSSQADARTYTRDIMQSMAGSTFRVGTGLYVVDELWDGFGGDDVSEDHAMMVLGRFVGDTLNTYTLPVNQVQDIMSQFNPEMRVIKETRDLNWFTYLYNRARRSSEFNLMDLPVKESGIKGANVRRKNPLIKQLSGLSYREDKTPLEQEFDRLQVEQREYLPYTGDAEFDRIAAHYMGPMAEKLGEKMLNSPEYTGAKDTKLTDGSTPFKKIKDADNRKASLLIESLKEAAQEAKTAAEAIIGHRVKYKKLPPRVRRQVNSIARDQYGMSVTEMAAQNPDAWAWGAAMGEDLR